MIAKFCRRKDCEKVLNAENNLKKWNANNLDITEGSRIFVKNVLSRIFVKKGFALTIVCFGLQAKNYTVSPKYLVEVV